MWYGKMTTYAEFVDLDPAASEPREEVIRGDAGETFHLWRNGSVVQVDVSCWSFERHAGAVHGMDRLGVNAGGRGRPFA